MRQLYDRRQEERSTRATRIGLALVLVFAAVLRARGIGWGLPALYEPDEPFFMLSGAKLLREHTLNPGWFGHPGTTTIYSLALIDLAVYGVGRLAGWFADPAAFARTFYLDPGVVVIPSRAFFLLCGVATVALTYLIGKRLFGARVGLVAALLLAADPLQIRYSQIIRTDVQMTLFLLVAVLAAIGIAQGGRRRAYLLAGLFLGIACATKWPAALAGVPAIAGAAAARLREDRAAAVGSNLALAAGAALLGLFLASPYIFLDFGTVLVNVRGEGRPDHPGATGGGFLRNAEWYAGFALRRALGPLGLLAAPAGMVIGARRSTAFAAVIVPLMLAFFAAISALSLIWERWMLPLLPFASLAIAVAIDAVIRRVAETRSRATAPVAALLIGLVVVPMLVTADGDARERATDTRALASAWARAHVAPGSTVLVEYIAIDLLDRDWRFRFPLGAAGCIDGRAALTGGIPVTRAESFKGSRTVVNVGTLPAERLPGCRSDYAFLTGIDRYRAEPVRYAQELANYRAFTAGARLVAVFRPVSGAIGGPVVRVFRFSR